MAAVNIFLVVTFALFFVKSFDIFECMQYENITEKCRLL